MGPKSLAEQIAELEDPTPKDFDPEDLERGGSDSEDEGGRAADSSAGREHYQAVGKAKLRKQDPVDLGKQYAGARVSRDALDADSDDDPFKARSSDEEEGSDDEDEDDLELGSDEDEDMSEESDEERPQKSKAAQKKGHGARIVDDMRSDDSEDIGSDEDSEDFDEDDMDDEIPSDEDEDEDEDDQDDDEEDDDEEEESSARRVKFAKPAKSDDREELRRLMASDQKTITATISQAAKADAVKGKAVKQQRTAFDALLNTRIKLQKGLTAINQLSVAAKEEEDLDGEAIKSAESAALALWSTLEDLRLALADAQTQDESKKRKRPSAVSPSTSTASLWKRMADLESDSVAHRRAILDKWSLKVRGSNATVPNSRGKLLGSAASGQQKISAVLDAQIASETDRAAKRARTANGSSAGDEDQEPIYDDTIFYQSLLRDLVEQRMSSSDAITNGIDTLHIQLPSRGLSIHPVTGMRKDKVKRDVDTRASKGRKMRFEVHEKLQNFMAPEERGTWTTHARDEFFASLLGKTASGMLREGDDEDASAAEESDSDHEEGGLRLFRG